MAKSSSRLFWPELWPPVLSLVVGVADGELVLATLGTPDHMCVMCWHTAAELDVWWRHIWVGLFGLRLGFLLWSLVIYSPKKRSVKHMGMGGKATDRPFNQPMESDRKIPRHSFEKLCNQPIRFLALVKSFQWCPRTESKIRPDDTI